MFCAGKICLLLAWNCSDHDSCVRAVKNDGRAMDTLKHLSIVERVRAAMKTFPYVVLHYTLERNDPQAYEIMRNLEELRIHVLHTFAPGSMKASPPIILRGKNGSKEPEIFREFEKLDVQGIPVLDYTLGIATETDGYTNPVKLRDFIYYWRNYFIPGFDPMIEMPADAPNHQEGHRIVMYTIPQFLRYPDKICACK